MTITNNIPNNIVVEKFPVAKDSLKFAGLEKSFNIVDIVPSSDILADDIDPQYSAQINNILPTLNALQTAKKSLSDVQSIVKDIKSNYKTEKNDAYAPIDDTMLRQRYEATLQIKDILANAMYNHKNVFTMDYSDKDITLDLGRKDLSKLNLRDEHSINIFSDNIAALSNQIEGEIAKLQKQIDKIEQGRWLSMEKLRNVRLEQKAVNESLKSANATTPSLASALAQVAQAPNANAINLDTQASSTQEAQNPATDSQPNTATTNNVIVGVAKPSTQNQLDSAVESAVPTNTTESNNASTQNQEVAQASNEATTNPNQANSAQESQNITTDSQSNSTTNANQNTTQAQDSQQAQTAQAQEATNTQNTAQADSQQTNATQNPQAQTTTQAQQGQNTQTQNSTAQAQSASNTANAQNAQADSQHNVIGVVSGDDKEQVVDLYM